MPPATAGPATAAITGLPSSRRDGPIGPRGGRAPSGGKSSASSARTSFPWSEAPYLRSHPAQNAPCEPKNTPARASGSRSNASNAATSASAVAGSTALRASGRSMITVVTGPSFST